MLRTLATTSIAVMMMTGVAFAGASTVSSGNSGSAGTTVSVTVPDVAIPGLPTNGTPTQFAQGIASLSADIINALPSVSAANRAAIADTLSRLMAVAAADLTTTQMEQIQEIIDTARS